MAEALTEIIKISQELEQTLEKKFGATGRGLHEKLTSVEKKVAPDVGKKIRLIATIRNKAVHEDANSAVENVAVVRQAYAVVKPALARGPLTEAERMRAVLEQPKRPGAQSPQRRTNQSAPRQSATRQTVQRTNAARQPQRRAGVAYGRRRRSRGPVAAMIRFAFFAAAATLAVAMISKIFR